MRYNYFSTNKKILNPPNSKSFKIYIILFYNIVKPSGGSGGGLSAVVIIIIVVASLLAAIVLASAILIVLKRKQVIETKIPVFDEYVYDKFFTDKSNDTVKLDSINNPSFLN